MIRPLITSIRTLTIFPIPGKDTDNFSRSLPFFPVVGFLLGAIVFGVFKGSQYISFNQPLIIVILALILETIVTGALHIDGLGDVADGFGSRKNKDEILAIFKDSRMGAFGICAIVFDLLIKTTCWYELYKNNMYSVIIFSLVFSRCVQALYVTFLPNARDNSTLTPFTKPGIIIRINLLCSVVLSIALSMFFLGILISLVYIIIILFVALLFGIYCLWKIKGITGDCVGAVSEITEITFLLSGIFLPFFIKFI